MPSKDFRPSNDMEMVKSLVSKIGTFFSDERFVDFLNIKFLLNFNLLLCHILIKVLPKMKPAHLGIYFKLGLLVVFVTAVTITSLVGIPYLITYANESLFRSLGFVGSDLTDLKLISGIIVFASVAAALERFFN